MTCIHLIHLSFPTSSSSLSSFLKTFLYIHNITLPLYILLLKNNSSTVLYLHSSFLLIAFSTIPLFHIISLSFFHDILSSASGTTWKTTFTKSVQTYSQTCNKIIIAVSTWEVPQEHVQEKMGIRDWRFRIFAINLIRSLFQLRAKLLPKIRGVDW